MSLLGVDDRRWLEFVEGRRDATIFHHPAWAGLLADTYGYRAMAVTLTDGGAIAAGLPVIEVRRPIRGRRWVSLPFTDWCPALAGGDRSVLVKELADIARSHGIPSVELRAPLPEGPSVRSETVFVRHVMALGPESVTGGSGLSTNHRRNLRAAERAGVRIVRGSSAADLEEFYRLCMLTRRRLGVPIQPRRFFRLLRERLLGTGLAFVVSAYSGDVAVASAVFSAWNGTLVFKYGARDDRWARLGANHLLMWSAIRWAAENGCHTVDLGRSALGQPELRRFKSGWGAREEPLAYTWIGNAPRPGGSRPFEAALAVLIRNSSPWVCRAMGELFYRYAA